jgi:hypothetical protein
MARTLVSVAVASQPLDRTVVLIVIVRRRLHLDLLEFGIGRSWGASYRRPPLNRGRPGSPKLFRKSLRPCTPPPQPPAPPPPPHVHYCAGASEMHPPYRSGPIAKRPTCNTDQKHTPSMQINGRMGQSAKPKNANKCQKVRFVHIFTFVCILGLCNLPLRSFICIFGVRLIASFLHFGRFAVGPDLSGQVQIVKEVARATPWIPPHAPWLFARILNCLELKPKPSMISGRSRGTPRARQGRAAGRAKIGYAVTYDSGGWIMEF